MAATPLDVDHVLRAGRLYSRTQCLQLDDELIYALHRCCAAPTDMSPLWTSSGPTALVSLQVIVDELVAAFPHEFLNLPPSQRTPSPPRLRARKGWACSPGGGGGVESPAVALLKVENEAMPVVRVLLRESPGKAVPRSPGLDSYPGSHVTDHPESRQYRGISIRILPVQGICRRHQRRHGRGHPNRSLGERVSREGHHIDASTTGGSQEWKRSHGLCACRTSCAGVPRRRVYLFLPSSVAS